MSDGLSLNQCEEEPSAEEGLALIEAFLAIAHRRHRDAVVALARALKTAGAGADREPAEASSRYEC